MRKTTIVSLLLVIVMLAALLGAHNAVSLYAGLAQWIPAALALSQERCEKTTNTAAWVEAAINEGKLFETEKKKWHQILLASRLSCPATIKKTASYPSIEGAATVSQMLGEFSQSASEKGEHNLALRYALCQYTVACQFLFHERASLGLSLKRMKEGLPLLSKSIKLIKEASGKAQFAPTVLKAKDMDKRLAALITIFPLLPHAASRELRTLPSLPQLFASKKKLSTIDVKPSYIVQRCTESYPLPKAFESDLRSANEYLRKWKSKFAQLESKVGVKEAKTEAITPSISLIIKSVYSLQSAFMDILLVTLVPQQSYSLFEKECELRKRLIDLQLRWRQREFMVRKGRPAMELSELELPPSLLYDPLTGRRTRLLVEVMVESSK